LHPEIVGRHKAEDIEYRIHLAPQRALSSTITQSRRSPTLPRPGGAQDYHRISGSLRELLSRKALRQMYHCGSIFLIRRSGQRLVPAEKAF
jgi:hypothetical protein